MDGAELREMLSPRAGSGTYDAYMKAFCARKHNSDFAREMTRSVAKNLWQLEMPMEWSSFYPGISHGFLVYFLISEKLYKVFDMAAKGKRNSTNLKQKSQENDG